MLTPEDRYRTDVAFAALVDTMHDYIVRVRFTPSELREAAILAAIRYELRRPVPARLIEAEALLDALKGAMGSL